MADCCIHLLSCLSSEAPDLGGPCSPCMALSLPYQFHTPTPAVSHLEPSSTNQRASVIMDLFTRANEHSLFLKPSPVFVPITTVLFHQPLVERPVPTRQGKLAFRNMDFIIWIPESDFSQRKHCKEPALKHCITVGLPLPLIESGNLRGLLFCWETVQKCVTLLPLKILNSYLDFNICKLVRQSYSSFGSATDLTL